MLRVLLGLRSLGLGLPVLKEVGQRLQSREAWPRERLRLRYLVGGTLEIDRAKGVPELPAVSLVVDGFMAAADVQACIAREAKSKAKAK